MTPPMRRKLLPCLLASLCAPSLAAEVTTLPVVEVSASAEDGWLKPERATPSTVYRVGGEALGAFGNPGGTNPYLNLADLPGVKITPVDAYGLNNMQGGQKGMRVRGEVSTHGVSGTVEGLALNGPGPGPGYLFLFDRENLASLTFAQGALAADQAGLFNSYGALDSQLLWPRREAGGELSFSMGSERFQRVFARADSGQLASGTAFFISASDTRANKWRGDGQAPGNRDNLEFGLSQALGPLNLKLWYARNDQSQHNYQALTYKQATNLDAYYRSDYPNNRNSAQHYDYNRQDFRNEALLAELNYTFSPTLSLSIKPFYSREQGYYLYAGSSDTQVLKWLIDHSTYGVNSELRGLWGDTEIKLGHSWTSTEPPGPPTTRTQYVIRNGSLQFDRWAMLSKTVDRHEFHSFYLSALHQAGPLTVQGGLRYARETPDQQAELARRSRAACATRGKPCPQLTPTPLAPTAPGMSPPTRLTAWPAAMPRAASAAARWPTGCRNWARPTSSPRNCKRAPAWAAPSARPRLTPTTRRRPAPSPPASSTGTSSSPSWASSWIWACAGKQNAPTWNRRCISAARATRG